jgi:hypothetical protein
LAYGFAKNTRNTTSIPAFFACAIHQIHRRLRRQTINQCFLIPQKYISDAGVLTRCGRSGFIAIVRPSAFRDVRFLQAAVLFVQGAVVFLQDRAGRFILIWLQTNGERMKEGDLRWKRKLLIG